MTDLTVQKFVAGYIPNPQQQEIHWLCNHPDSLDLIFAKDKAKAFEFEDENAAKEAMLAILVAENRSWLCPVVELSQTLQSQVEAEQNKLLSQKEAEAKIKELLKLFNERSNSRLDLFLTFNEKDYTLRGYGNGVKLGDSVSHFVSLLVIKGFNVECLDQHRFIVKLK